jgi:hypothetical protein
VLLLPGIALALRLPVPQALRYGALALCIPIPYLLMMQEHGPWILAQVCINGVSLGLLGLLALHGLRHSAVKLQTQTACRVPAAGI